MEIVGMYLALFSTSEYHSSTDGEKEIHSVNLSCRGMMKTDTDIHLPQKARQTEII
jgi:hypothetical protein